MAGDGMVRTPNLIRRLMGQRADPRAAAADGREIVLGEIYRLERRAWGCNILAVLTIGLVILTLGGGAWFYNSSYRFAFEGVQLQLDLRADEFTESAERVSTLAERSSALHAGEVDAFAAETDRLATLLIDVRDEVSIAAGRFDMAYSLVLRWESQVEEWKNQEYDGLWDDEWQTMLTEVGRITTETSASAAAFQAINAAVNDAAVGGLDAWKGESLALQREVETATQKLSNAAQAMAETGRLYANRSMDLTNTDFVQLTITRIGVIAVVIFLVTILVPLVRFLLRLAAFYQTRANTLSLAFLTDVPVSFADLTAAFDPPLEFGKGPRTPIQDFVELAKVAAGPASRKPPPPGG